MRFPAFARRLKFRIRDKHLPYQILKIHRRQFCISFLRLNFDGVLADCLLWAAANGGIRMMDSISTAIQRENGSEFGSLNHSSSIAGGIDACGSMMIVSAGLPDGLAGLNQLTAFEHGAAIVGIADFFVGLQPVLFDHGTDRTDRGDFSSLELPANMQSACRSIRQIRFELTSGRLPEVLPLHRQAQSIASCRSAPLRQCGG